jgi:hypothetical protein
MSWEEINESGKLYYTILIYGKLVNDVKKKLLDDLDKVNKRMKDAYKKKIINNRLYQIIKVLDSQFKDNDILNCIILSGRNLNYFTLSQNELKLCNKWNIKNFYIEYDDKFRIKYLKNLFSENKINLIFEFNGDVINIIELDKVKSRFIDKINVDNYNEILDLIEKNNPKIIHGIGSTIKKLKDLNNVYYKRLSSEEINDIINKMEINESQNILKKEVLNQLSNPAFDNKFLFGKKEVSNGIMDYMIKKLYITSSLMRQLRKNISKDYLNFEILEVDSLESGDIGYIFLKDYDGIIGLKYY